MSIEGLGPSTARTRISIVVFMLITALVVTVGAPRPAGATLSDPVTAAFLDSEPGDVIGQGQQLAFPTVTPTTATTSHLAFSLSTLDLEHSFTVEFVGPNGADLAAGAYENAEIAGSQTTGHAGFAVAGDAHSCTTVGARFIVDDVQFSGSTLTSFSARFEQHCNGNDPTLFGAVSYSSTANYRERPVTPNSIAFGNVVVNTTSNEHTVTLTNHGPSDLNVTGKSITGANPGQFSVSTDTCTGGPITSGNSCTLGVKFSPTGALGPRSATLTFFDDLAPSGGGGTGRDIKLTGQVFPAGTPVTAAFVDTEPGDPIGNGQQFSSTTVSVVNATPTAVQLTATVGPNTFGLKFSSVETTLPTLPDPLAVGTYENTRPFTAPSGFPSLTVSRNLVSCDATSNGRFLLDQIAFGGAGELVNFSARFEFHCNAGDPAVFGAVSYNATAPYRERPVSPNSLSFGNVIVNTTSGEQTVTLTNNGPSALGVTSTTITGANSGQFSVSSDTCTTGPVASGNSCTLGVEFSPTGALGPRSATLTFFDDLAPSGGGGTGRDIKLTGQVFPAGTPVTDAFLDSEPNEHIGQGQQLGFASVTPTTATTNHVALNVTSLGHSFTVDFVGPDGADLATGTYENAQLAGSQSAGHAGFAVSGDGRSCGATTTGRFLVDQIAFDGGGTLVNFSARFELHCNGDDAALFGAVSYNATAPYRERLVAPNSRAFGSVVIGTASTEQTVTLTNNGPSALNFSSTSIGGANAGQFSVSSNTCTGGPVASGGSCVLGITFSPTGSPGPRAATLTFFDDLAPSGGGGTGRDIKLTGQAFPTGTPVTAAFLDSEPNEHVGQGQQLAFTSMTPTSATTNDIAFNVTSLGHSFTVEFVGPDGADLAAGTYENAQLAGSQSAGHPGLAASGDGQSCDATTTGRFLVDQIVFDGGGTLVNFSARFELHCNAGDPALFGAVSYHGTAPYRARLVAPNARAFGNVVIGSTSTEQTVTLTNNGPSSLTVSSKTITGTNAGQFSVSSDTCTGGPVASGNSCTFGIKFSPTGSLGPRSATFTFFDNLAPSGGGGTGRDIKLTGQAFPTGTPVTAAFVDTEAGDPIGNGQQFSSTSIALVDATPTAVQLTATVGGTTFGLDFSSVQTTLPTVPSPLAPGTYENTRPFPAPSGFPSLTVNSDLTSCDASSNGRFLLDQIAFDGDGALVNFSARFEFHCNGGDPAVFGAVSYHGTSPYRTVTNDSTVAFGNVFPGNTSAPQSFTLTNNGPATLAFGAASLTGTDAAQFSITGNTCSGNTIAVSASCSITMTFTPTGSAGQRSAKLRFFDDLAPSGGGGTGRDIRLTGSMKDPSGEFTSLTPARLLETRPGFTTIDGQFAGGGPVGNNSSIDVQITGRGGVPAAAQVSAVVLNATITGPNNFSFLTVWPTGVARPTISNLNYFPNQTVPNSVTVALGSGGKVSVYNNQGSVHVILDVVGYYASSTGPAGSRFHGVTPSRYFDTRFGTGGVPAQKIGTDTSLKFNVLGKNGIPASGVTGVVMNVTATEATSGTFVTVFPDDVSRPNASNLNFGPNQTVPNLVTVRVPASGIVDFYNNLGATHLIADVVGYYDDVKDTEAGRFVAVTPFRKADTRTASPFPAPGKITAGAALLLRFPGFNGLPATGVGSMVMNVTVTEPDLFSFVTVYPPDGSLPLASNLNFNAGDTIPNQVITKVSTGPIPSGPSTPGWIAYFNKQGNTHLIVDVFGFFTDENFTATSVEVQATGTTMARLGGG